MGTILGLDIGSRAVKFVQIKESRGKRYLLNFGLKEIPSRVKEKDKAIVETIKDLLREKKIRTKRATAFLAGPSVTIRCIQVPLMSKAELAEGIGWRVREISPMEPEKTVIDFQILGRIIDKKGQKKLNLLVVVAEKELIAHHLSLLKSAGLKPQRITLIPLALAKAFEEKAKNNKAIALINVGTERTDIVILKGGGVVLSRGISSLGSDSVTQLLAGGLGLGFKEAEDLLREEDLMKEGKYTPFFRPALERLKDEIERSFAYYNQQFRTRVEQIILSGEGCQLKNLAQFLAEELGKRVEVGNSLQKMNCDNLTLKQRKELSSLQSHFSLGIGLAQKSPGTINLLKPKTKRKRWKALMEMKASFPSLLILAIVLTYFAIMGRINEIREEVERKASEETKVVRIEEPKPPEPSPPPEPEPIKIVPIIKEEPLSVTGILLGEKRAAAIINGRILRVGDTVEGKTIIAIEKDRVILKKGSEKHILKIREVF